MSQRMSDNEGAAEGEEDTEFLNFTYNNLTTLMQKNLELARADRCGAASPVAEIPREFRGVRGERHHSSKTRRRYITLWQASLLLPDVGGRNFHRGWCKLCQRPV